MYEEELKEIGLTDNETKVYLTLLKNKVLNPTKLAEKTGLHRSYIYDTLERLIERGIINTVTINGKKHYQSINPKVLREIFELKLRKLDSILPKLAKLHELNDEETEIELYRGKGVYRTLIKYLISDLRKNDTVYLLGVDENKLETVEPIYLKQYFTIIKEKGVREKIIIPLGGKRLNERNIEYREISSKYLGDTTIVIYQKKVFIFVWGDPYYLIIIKSHKIAQTYLRQFNLFWEIAR